MARNADKIAKGLGAQRKGRVPDVGGGAFGMARIASILSKRLQPSLGTRPGRPSDPKWVVQGKIPMSEQTKERLTVLAEQLSQDGRRVSPMQLAAQLLEDSLAQLPTVEIR
jgi:hypothetical protein